MSETENMTGKALLEGGPLDLAERVVPVASPGADVKVQHRNGYEHFRPTQRRAETEDGEELPVYEWWERTEMPG
ncbi:DUF5988 family protein [Streptomyces beihaiensis]|uniref:DUF5988 family protein n=1 Tax=Streptomyces beihaiensis TaxID=2984495 RepID=A0ABT3TVI2_9ACTN|nr:DUF5988 family protein [Streptomyces beihaiensis]MCX3060795.1 DUF5988 family protein [Streptomyces beihaiensis]